MRAMSRSIEPLVTFCAASWTTCRENRGQSALSAGSDKGVSCAKRGQVHFLTSDKWTWPRSVRPLFRIYASARRSNSNWGGNSGQGRSAGRKRPPSKPKTRWKVDS